MQDPTIASHRLTRRHGRRWDLQHWRDKYRCEECQWRMHKIHGKLKCKIKMKGVGSDGYAYVTPYNSLIGLEWIRASEDMKYHSEMMTAEVKMASIAGIEEELKKTYPEIFKEGLRRCYEEEAGLQLNQNVRPVFCNSRPVLHAALEAVNAELGRLVQMDVITPVSRMSLHQ
ncbi:hypothetical protein GCK32_022848 [Trichostrongylus colubriformis]|uniref:Uncharacterized protein n=1 Tax=Trichostrongylus colubriformis TaxID=6319 RepID=A0AAN8FA43_TRICO